MTITLRSTKGSALTYGEVDGNFSDLDARTEALWANLSGQVIIGTTSAPTYVEYKGVPLITFSPDTMMQASVLFQIPKNYVAGTDIYLHMHVTSAAASSGVVRWGFEYTHANEWLPEDGTPTAVQYFGAPTTIYTENTKTAADLDLHRIVVPSAGQSITGLASDAVVLARIFRDAAHVNDTYPDPVHLLYVDLYYRAQKFGSAGR